LNRRTGGPVEFPFPIQLHRIRVFKRESLVATQQSTFPILKSSSFVRFAAVSVGLSLSVSHISKLHSMPIFTGLGRIISTPAALASWPAGSFQLSKSNTCVPSPLLACADVLSAALHVRRGCQMGCGAVIV
jgi:hypothetical protein